MAILDLIGSSPKFQAVLDEINIIAPLDSTVLISGETGTGKEVIAQAIHNAGPRRWNKFVGLNCAAIPGALLESELFGHERGAFTGALNQTTGRFQTADRGTLFLDEIGDLPLELQPKLLRVLQEQAFERVGSTRTISVDVRVIAATNQDLWGMVQERTFRADLYYRLNVFPIVLPPLREREEDIPLLARHFVGNAASRFVKPIKYIPDEVLEVLKTYHWPGNIRELQNFMERSVILSQGSVLDPPLAELESRPKETKSASGGTLAELERAHIAATLRETKGIVGGRGGAAVRLGLPRTTLISKIQKLGVKRENIGQGAAAESAL